MKLRIAIYSRKSKFTGKGESIGNQIQLCRDYLRAHWGEDQVSDVRVYEDEGYSGGDTERPQFQEMLRDASAKKFDALICYRLDRISRNVNDFSTLIEQLAQSGISFISIREQFDTSTPMGRAMMYIASVFAQLERDTIAERIRDNMLELAKTGRWLGGVTPTGFSSKELVTVDAQGKERKSYKLQPIKRELAVIALLYQKFVELGSLTKLETYCLQNGISSKNGKQFSRITLKNILSNPVYAVADKTAYDFLNANGYEVYAPLEDFDGTRGLLAYNKTLQKKHVANKQRDKADWIIAVGKHRGTVPSAVWTQAQQLLLLNKSKSYRKVRNSESLLSGLLRCGACGSYMRPRTSGRIDKDGHQTFYYMCETKEKSHKKLCAIKNANGNELDRLVVEEIKRLSESESALGVKLRTDIKSAGLAVQDIQTEEELIREKIVVNDQSIKKLVDTLPDTENTAASKYLIARINELDSQNKEFKARLVEIHEEMDSTKENESYLQTVSTLLSSFSASVDTLSISELRGLLRSIVERIEWNGTDVRLELFGKNK